MGLPTSGNLSIKDGAGTTRSIAREVDGNVTGDKSLTTLSITASKTAPHSMLEFYGYCAATTKCIGLHEYYTAGSQGSPCRRAYYCLCSVPDYEAGDSATVCVCYCLTNFANSSSMINYSCYCTCFSTYYYDTHSNSTDSSTYTYHCADSLSSTVKPRVCLYACSNNQNIVGVSGYACAIACISCISSSSGSNFIIDVGNQLGSAAASDS